LPCFRFSSICKGVWRAWDCLADTAVNFLDQLGQTDAVRYTSPNHKNDIARQLCGDQIVGDIRSILTELHGNTLDPTLGPQF
jgi:hypothetical protein